MAFTAFQNDRGNRWCFWATMALATVLALLLLAYLTINIDPIMLNASGVSIVLYSVCLLVSNSRTLLGGYRYFVWEPDGAVHVWDNGVVPTDYYAFGIPTHGIFLKPVVIVPKFKRHGWSLRVLPNGHLMLRDHDGAQQRFVFRTGDSSHEIEDATEVLQLLRDAYWAYTVLANQNNHGTIWWAMRRREHRYWDVRSDCALLADAIALVAGRLEKSTASGRFADAVKSPTGAWALSFTRRVLAWALPTDDPRRTKLAIVECLPGSRETVRLEVEAGPDGPLPKRLPAERVEALSSADAPSGA